MVVNGNAHQEPLADSVKYTVMMNMAPSHTKTNLHLCTSANSAALRNAFLQWCYSKRNLGAPGKTRRLRATPTAWKWTLSERARVRAKEKRQQSKGPRPGNVDANTCNNCGTSGHWAKDWRKPGGNLVEMQITAPTEVSTKAKARAR